MRTEQPQMIYLKDYQAPEYLMSDAGGPTLTSWRTVAQPEGEGFKLHIDKVWGMYANLAGMAIVAARTPGSFFPSAFLVWPEQYKTLKRTLCGEPFIRSRAAGAWCVRWCWRSWPGPLRTC